MTVMNKWSKWVVYIWGLAFELFCQKDMFVDMDLDRNDLGGNLTWTPPTEASQVTTYVVYLADNPTGLNKTFFGTTMFGVNNITVPTDTAILANTQFLVYAPRSGCCGI